MARVGEVLEGGRPPHGGPVAYDRAMTRRFLVFACLCVALAHCRDAGPSLAERAAAARAAEEAAAAKAREESRARAEAERLAALWRYQQADVGGAQVTAAIFAAEPVDTDGSGARPVQLVFRDHQKWGRSAYLVLQAGDFACRPDCAVQVTVDDRAAERLASWRPDTDEAIALFVRDHARLWTAASRGTRLRIEFPVRAGGTRAATFEVSALDPSRMPGWPAE
jgi:ADP-ribose pyrophosphatase YjhB (NUDIX family)